MKKRRVAAPLFIRRKYGKQVDFERKRQRNGIETVPKRPPTGLVRLRLSRKMAKITKSLGTQFCFAARMRPRFKEIGRCAHFFLAIRFGILGQQVRAGSRRDPQVFWRGTRANTLESLCI